MVGIIVGVLLLKSLIFRFKKTEKTDGAFSKNVEKIYESSFVNSKAEFNRNASNFFAVCNEQHQKDVKDSTPTAIRILIYQIVLRTLQASGIYFM